MCQRCEESAANSKLEKELKYYLQYTTQYFVDPHGSPNEGGTEKSVIVSNDLGDLDLSLEYDEDNQIVDEDDWNGSEDGYNAEYVTYFYK